MVLESINTVMAQEVAMDLINKNQIEDNYEDLHQIWR